MAMAFLAAMFVAATATPGAGAVAPGSGCADFLCTEVSLSNGCPGCGGNDEKSDHRGTMACPALCAAMTAVLPAAAEIASTTSRAADGPAPPAPHGIARAPERAPPRASIPA